MEYRFIGWCKQDSSDKVWVVINLGNRNWATVWGRRGKRLQYKILADTSAWAIEKLENSKVSKGYKSIERSNLDTVYPEFEHDLEAIGIWAVLSANTG